MSVCVIVCHCLYHHQAAVNDPNPGGLKRMNWSTVKDLEVIMDRDAAPLDSDDPFMKMIRPMLAGWVCYPSYQCICVKGRGEGGKEMGGCTPI